MVKWAKRLVLYEQAHREDTPPPEWQVLTTPPIETPADGPGFTPQVAWATLHMNLPVL